MLRLILGGVALQRGGNRAALAAEVIFSNRKLVLPRPAGTCLAIILLSLMFSTYSLADSGVDVYNAKCSACHGKNGARDTILGKNLKLRLLGSDDVQNPSDDELLTII